MGNRFTPNFRGVPFFAERKSFARALVKILTGLIFLLVDQLQFKYHSYNGLLWGV
ncbi:MAG: hypothetical protein JWM11_1096, partial [Planctomycetaceae bacterium]|nr:hypothetical protein [Planctomycetaceae bacterium]